MEKVVREMLIRKIYEIDCNHKEEIFSDIMLDGFKGYNNMTTFNLMKIYMEYHGLESLEHELKGIIDSVDDVAKQDDTGEGIYVHLAYNGSEINPKDLYAVFIIGDDDRLTNEYEWGIFSMDLTSDPRLYEMLIEFGFDENFLHQECV